MAEAPLFSADYGFSLETMRETQKVRKNFAWKVFIQVELLREELERDVELSQVIDQCCGNNRQKRSGGPILKKKRIVYHTQTETLKAGCRPFKTTLNRQRQFSLQTTIANGPSRLEQQQTHSMSIQKQHHVSIQRKTTSQ